MNEFLNIYLQTPPESSLILQGNNGLRSVILQDALEASGALLSSKYVELHPDFLLINKGEDNYIGIEAVSTIASKCSLKPSIADRIVILIDGINEVTETAQNKLLKLIEEAGSKVIFILVSTDSYKVLDTIKSRCRTITYKPLSKTDFIDKGFTSTEYFVSAGNPDSINREVVEIFNMVEKHIKDGNKKGLLEVLHLVKEKDSDNFYLAYPDYVSSLFSFIGEITTSIETMEVCSIYSNIDNITKEEFFCGIAKI